MQNQQGKQVPHSLLYSPLQHSLQWKRRIIAENNHIESKYSSWNKTNGSKDMKSLVSNQQRKSTNTPLLNQYEKLKSTVTQDNENLKNIKADYNKKRLSTSTRLDTRNGKVNEDWLSLKPKTPNEKVNFTEINNKQNQIIEFENERKHIGQRINSRTPDIKINYPIEKFMSCINKPNTLKRNNFIFHATGNMMPREIGIVTPEYNSQDEQITLKEIKKKKEDELNQINNRLNNLTANQINEFSNYN